MVRTLIVLAGVVAAAPISAEAAVQTKKITYKHGNLECQGYLAWDDAVQGRRPGVLVVHEWWGLNDYARQRAEQLAKLGYVAFAADMYGEGKTAQHPKEAGEMATKVRANVEDWRKLARAMGALSEAPIYIDDSPTLSAMEIRAKARKVKAEHGLGLVVVDYIQMIQARGRSENRTQELSEIVRALKSMAKELEVPLIAVSQLSRAVETMGSRRPMLSHLRESGELEAVADVVLFLYREDCYDLEKTQPWNSTLTRRCRGSAIWSGGGRDYWPG